MPRSHSIVSLLQRLANVMLLAVCAGVLYLLGWPRRGERSCVVVLVNNLGLLVYQRYIAVMNR